MSDAEDCRAATCRNWIGPGFRAGWEKPSNWRANIARYSSSLACGDKQVPLVADHWPAAQAGPMPCALKSSLLSPTVAAPAELRVAVGGPGLTATGDPSHALDAPSHPASFTDQQRVSWACRQDSGQGDALAQAGDAAVGGACAGLEQVPGGLRVEGHPPLLGAHRAAALGLPLPTSQALAREGRTAQTEHAL